MSRDYSQVAAAPSVERAAQTLEANGFTVFIEDDLSAASDKVLELIPAGSEVFTATSVTLTTAGLDKELNESGNYVSAREKFMHLYGQPDKALEMRRLGSASDFAIGSVHAITEEGHIMVASNSGSQLPNYAYGANHVILLVGAQKVVKDMNEAWDRLENHTFPLENERAQKAYGRPSAISKVLFLRKDPQQRITVVLFNEAVGY